MAPQQKLRDDEFIEAWNSSSDVNDVAAMAGTTSTSASTRASKLRKAGNSLKFFKGANRGIDDDEFVQVWNSSDSAHDVAAHFSIPESTARNKAAALRNQGRHLRKRKTSIQTELLKDILETLKRIEEKLNA